MNEASFELSNIIAMFGKLVNELSFMFLAVPTDSKISI